MKTALFPRLFCGLNIICLPVLILPGLLNCCYAAENSTKAGTRPVLLKISQVASFLTPSDVVTLTRGTMQTQNAQLVVTDSDRAVSSADYIGPVGRIGDWISLERGNYIMSFDGPEGYTLNMGLHVSEKGVTTTGLEANGLSECRYDQHVFVAGWTPSIQASGGAANKYELLFAAPSTVRYSDRMRPCFSPALWEPQKTVKISVSSIPAGAEILVNGRSIGTTNATINIPCRSEDKLDELVVLRKKGFVNCVKKITSETGDKLTCKLVRP